MCIRDRSYIVTVTSISAQTSERAQLRTFFLSVAEPNTPLTISAKIPQIGILRPGKKVIFRYPVNIAEEGLYISKTTFGNDVTVWAAAERGDNANFDTNQISNRKLTDFTSDVLPIEKAFLNDILVRPGREGQSGKQGWLYINVENPGENDATYSIFLSNKNALPALIDGVPQNVRFPVDGAQNFIYHPVSFAKNVKITAMTHISPGIELYANIVAFNGVKDVEAHALEVGTYVSDSQLTSNAQYVAVSPDTLSEKCEKSTNCLILITIKNVAPLVKPNDEALTATLIVNSGLTTIQIGKPTIVHAGEGLTEYFRFNVTAKLAGILVTVTPINGANLDFSVNYGRNKLGNSVADGDFRVKSIASGELLITAPEFKKIYPDRETMEGEYIIAVDASEFVSVFQISVTYGETKNMQIYPSLAQDLTLQAGKSIQLRYYHSGSEDFNVIFSREIGSLSYFVSPVPKVKSGLVTDPSSAPWIQKLDNNREVLTVSSKDKSFCSECYYQIYIEAEEHSRVSVIVKRNDMGSILRVGKPLLDTNLAGKISTYFIDTRFQANIVLSLNILYGKVRVAVGDTDFEAVREAHPTWDFGSAISQIVKVRVTSDEDAAYELRVSDELNVITILEGINHRFNVAPGKTQLLRFVHTLGGDVPVSFFMKRLTFGTNEKDLSTSLEFTPVRSSETPSPKTETVESYRLSNPIDGLSAEYFLANEGTYDIKITNNHASKDIAFNFAIRATSFLTMQAGNPYISYTPVSGKHKFELYVNRPGSILLQIDNCQGDFLVALTEQKLTSGLPSAYVDKNWRSVSDVIEVKKPGRLFFTVDSQEINHLENIVPAYRIQAVYTRNEQQADVLEEVKELGKEAEIKEVGAGEYEIKFNQVQAKPQEDSDYFLVVAPDPDLLQQVARCGNFINNPDASYVKGVENCNVETKSCTVNFKVPEAWNQTASAMLVGRIFNKDLEETAEVVSPTFNIGQDKTIEVIGQDGKTLEKEPTGKPLDKPTGNGNGGGSIFPTLIIGILLIIVGFAGYYLYRRQQMIKSQEDTMNMYTLAASELSRL
eukprot:TRINITY_DN1170_c0_g1_i6.p1 TRINITY_DN1170_c0_g1~~TRINITY_DN1170_c0_g1_i6.p1  ORF type:complete len:1055 (+),score=369.59 TRINITY_DN1170_c0_g1_i6:66-3230(+)